MSKRVILLTVAAAVLCAGAACPRSGEEAALNRRNRDIGVELSGHEDPVVAVKGAEVASNAECLDHTTFDGAPTDVPTPISPEESAELRQTVADQHAQDSKLWDFVVTTTKELVGLIPGGSAVLGYGSLGLTALLAWWRKRQWHKLAASSVDAIHEVRQRGLTAAIGSILTDPKFTDVRDDLKTALEAMLKTTLSKAHEKAGVGDMAQQAVDAARP